METSTGPVYAIIEVKLKNPPRFMEYVQGHRPSMLQYGGQILLEYKRTAVYEGNAQWDILVIHQWPSEAAFKQWWDSPEYRPWKEMRSEGADVNLALATTLQH